MMITATTMTTAMIPY